MKAWQVTLMILSAHINVITNKKSLVKCLLPFLKRKNSFYLSHNKQKNQPMNNPELSF